MTFTFQPWMKTALIVLGVVVLVAIVVFLYLLIAGADESRRSKGHNNIENTDNEKKQQ